MADETYGVIPSNTAISLRNLRFRWPKVAEDCLQIDELVIKRGETVFLYGPSGSGKTTLLSLLTGINVAQAGTACVLGQDWRSLRSAQRDRYRVDHIGYIFQQFNLLPYLSALENVLLPCRLSTLRKQRVGGPSTEAAQQLLARFDLATPRLWRQLAGKLSVGQQQRVAAARALIGTPEIIIADEPTSAMDEPLRDQFIHHLLEVCAEHSTTLVFVSHDHRLSGHFSRQIDLRTLNQVRLLGETA